MILREIIIGQYKQFKNRRIALNGDRVVLFGHNEAGKSTILSFIESVLFGFKEAQSQYHGALVFMDEDERQWTIERKQIRNKRGELTILEADGKTYTGELADLLPDLDRNSFTAMFHISLDSLQQMNHMDAAELKRYLFHSTSGTKQLFDYEETLRKKRELLYKARGTTPLINAREKELGILLEKKREQESERLTYDAVCQSEDSLRQKLLELEEQREQVRETVKLEEKVVTVRPLLLEWLAEKEKPEPKTLVSVQDQEAIGRIREASLEVNRELARIDADLSHIDSSLDALPPLWGKERMRKARYATTNFATFTSKQEQAEDAEAELNVLKHEKAQIQQEFKTEEFPALQIGRYEEERFHELYTKKDREASAQLPVLTGIPLFLLALVATVFGQWIIAALSVLVYPIILALGRNKKPRGGRFTEWAGIVGATNGKDASYYRLLIDAYKEWQGVKKREDRAIDQLRKATAEMDDYLANLEIEHIPDDLHGFIAGLNIDLQTQDKLRLKRDQLLLDRQTLAQKQQSTLQEQQVLKNEEQAIYATYHLEHSEEFDQAMEATIVFLHAKEAIAALDIKLASMIPDKKDLEYAITHVHERESIEEHKEVLHKLQKEHTTLLEALTETRAQRQKLEQDGTYEDTLREIARCEADLADLTRKWAVYEAAIKMIEEVKHMYETDKQPQAVKRAIHHFRALTDNRYVSIYAPIGENRFIVERHDGKRFDPIELSRGTMEMLYIALRFAHMETRQTPFPVFIDEALVNMDMGRRQQMWEFLHKQQKQLLFFTCHEAIRDEAQKKDFRMVGL
ncbi:AAA family ATPase [Paenalkalicoccus suaedae]|uniref:AAA family ATPase n=1 Tax=Paenalkalicoccus suaedae TaxID=2592382 RepID=A0A859FBU5_9BACI|nr:AAA family ATPase [Paenalkalicoccus suaedae]QKS70739.1 AAA family ATPase [Paenalkalicoccus suaedae]